MKPEHFDFLLFLLLLSLHLFWFSFCWFGHSFFIFWFWILREAEGSISSFSSCCCFSSGSHLTSSVSSSLIASFLFFPRGILSVHSACRHSGDDKYRNGVWALFIPFPCIASLIEIRYHIVFNYLLCFQWSVFHPKSQFSYFWFSNGFGQMQNKSVFHLQGNAELWTLCPPV